MRFRPKRTLPHNFDSSFVGLFRFRLSFRLRVAPFRPKSEPSAEGAVRAAAKGRKKLGRKFRRHLDVCEVRRRSVRS